MPKNSSRIQKGETNLSSEQRFALEKIQNELEDLLRNRRFNPFLLDDLENRGRGILERQLNSSLAATLGWNQFLDLLREAKDDGSNWILSVEQALRQLTYLLHRDQEE